MGGRPVPETNGADPELIDEAADRLAAAARALGTAGSELTIAIPGWIGVGANGQATSAVALKRQLDTSCDAFGLAAGALRQYAFALRLGVAKTPVHNAAMLNVRDAAAQAASVVRTATAMAPSIRVPPPPQGPAIEMISWGEDLLGAGKSLGHGVESLGGDAVSAGKDLAHLGESAAGEVGDGFESFLGFVDDTNLALNGEAHAMFSTLGDTAMEIWGGLERAAGTRPGELLSIESLSHWRGWFGQVGLAIADPALRGALREVGELGTGAAAVAKVIFSDYGRYREIEKQQKYQPIKGAPNYDEIHRTAESDHHILIGNSKGTGGHKAHTGRPGKTEFPDDWDDKKILQAVDKAAQNPSQRMTQSTRGGLTRYRYVSDAGGFKIVIVIDSSGRIITAYPDDRQPNVYINPDAPGRASDFTRWGPRWVRPDRDPQGTGYFVWHRADGSDAYTDMNGNPVQR
jgi:hypothetical protein